MKIGFAKVDITPRIGMELYGYSGYLNRYATAVRDKLWARSMAVSDGKQVVIVVSCEIVFITRELTDEVRRLVQQELGKSDLSIMVHAIHTHSGPTIRVNYRNTYDPPYNKLLPRKIARSCITAVKSMQKAKIMHAQVPCEGMGTNRVYDKFNYEQAALQAGFRPDKPELTDTTCHVLKIVAKDKTLGFLSYFGCHNVVGGAGSTYIHGDFAGIATSMLERETPGAVGIFLQGAEGDVNTAGCVFGDDKVLEALDVMAGRFAQAVRHGLEVAEPIDADSLGVVSRQMSFSRLQIPLEELREQLAIEDAVVDNPDATDTDQDLRWAVLRCDALRSIIERLERGESLENIVEIQGFKIGPIALLGAPFEIFQAIKNDVVVNAKSPIPLVMSLTNDEQGYAVDSDTIQNGGYEARTAPLWKHTLPYANIHTELVNALLELDKKLFLKN